MRSNLLSRLKPEFKKGLEDNKLRYPDMTNDIEFLLTQLFYYDDLTLRQVLNIFVFSDMEYLDRKNFDWRYGEDVFEWTLADIKNRASNKAFAKVTILTLDVETYKEDLRTGNIGGVTYEEFEQVLEGYKTELQVWNYITELIEKQ
jgi:hypothetical protein